MVHVHYHRMDNDGKVAGAVAQLAFHMSSIPTKFIGFDYDDPIESFSPGDSVMFLDVSTNPLSRIVSIASSGHSVYIVDHHKTFIERYRDFLEIKIKTMELGDERDDTKAALERIAAVLDEHSTLVRFYHVIKVGHGSIEVFYGRGISGCELTWDYFFNDKKLSQVRPKIVTLAGRYDVFDTESPLWQDANHFNAGFAQSIKPSHTHPAESLESNRANNSYWTQKIKEIAKRCGEVACKIPEMDVNVVSLVDISTEFDIHNACSIGKVISEYLKNSSSGLMKRGAFVATFNGVRALCINSINGNSQLFDSMFNRKEHDIMLRFGYTGPEGIKVSLYSYVGGPDVSKLAALHEGGGHPQAAGFTAKKVDYDPEAATIAFVV